MYCMECGSECREGAKFCPKCGAELISPESVQDKTVRSKGKGAKGLFSKKTQTCYRCGKAFDARLSKLYCRECNEILEQKYNESMGYVELFDAIKGENHRGDERFYDEVMGHSNEILSLYESNHDVFEDEEYLEAMADFLNISVQEVIALITDLKSTVWEISSGNLLNAYFAMPAEYPGMVVDFKDVFAVGYCDFRLRGGVERITTLFLTNDPYAPVFSFFGVYPLGAFGIKKNKGVRDAMKAVYTRLCTELTYPVQEVETLKRTIMQDTVVRGNMGTEFALDQIEKALDRIIASSDEVSEVNLSILDRYGYRVYINCD